MFRWNVIASVSLVSMLAVAACASAGTDITPARKAELHELLIEDCGSCHGSRLLGGLGPALTKERLRQQSRQMLIETILAGRPGTAMPPWNTMLTRDEATWLVDQLLQGVKTP